MQLNDFSQKILEGAKRQEGLPYVLGGDGKSGTDCGLFAQTAVRNAGIDWKSRYVPYMMDEARSKGMWRDKDSGYVPRPGDMVVVNGDEHVVLVGENGGVWQAGRSKNSVYYSATNVIDMFGADNITGFISTSGGVRGTAGAAEFANAYNQQINPNEPVVTQEVPEEEDASVYDRLLNMTWDGAAWGAFRNAAMLKNNPADEGWSITQEDIDEVQTLLGGDYAATLWVSQNAQSAQHMQALARMKQEDIERRKRVDNSSIGWKSIGSIVGILLDPTNYISIIGATGKLGNLQKYLRIAAANTALNVGERKGAEIYAGYQQDYAMAAMVSAVAGAGLPALADGLGYGFRKGSRYLDEAEAAYRTAQKNADSFMKTGTFDNVSSKVRKVTPERFRRTVNKMNDTEFLKKSYPDIAKRFDGDPNVSFMSRRDAARLHKALGSNMPKGAKGFYDSNSGMSIIIKDAVKDSDDIVKTIMHERGAHGLRYTVSEHDYNQIINDVRHRMRSNPSPDMQRAMSRAYDKGDPEEVLGYLIEEMSKENPFVRGIRKSIQKTMRTMGYKGTMTERELADIVEKAAEKHTEMGKAYTTLSDGTTVFNDFKYSEQNILNPKNIDGVARMLKNTKNWIGKQLATSKFFATPWTIAEHTPSRTYRSVIGQLIDNPHMDEALDGFTAETLKREILAPLNLKYGEYLDLRNKIAVERSNRLKTTFTTTMRNELDKETIMAYNQLYAGHSSGVKFSPEAYELAKKTHEWRQLMEEQGKNLSKISGEGKNYFTDDWSPGTQEFHRFVDDDKVAQYIAQFPTIDKAREFLTNYAKRVIDEDAVYKQLKDVAEAKFIKDTVKYEAAMADTPMHKLKKPKRQEVTESMLANEVDKQSKAWAESFVGIQQNGMSVSNLRVKTVGKLDFMERRVPMDTSKVVKDSFGFDFSFDEVFRAYDMDGTVPYIMNRWAGELALYNKLSSGNIKVADGSSVTKGIQELRDIINNELNLAEKGIGTEGRISKSNKVRDLKTFDATINKLRGLSTEIEPRTKLDAFAQLLTNMSYARNGANMGLNQLGEQAGTLAYAGFNTIPDLIPALGRKVTSAHLGAQANDILAEASKITFGENSVKRIWDSTKAVSSDTFVRVGTGSAFDKFMDGVAGGVKAGSSFVSTISGLNKLTDIMINSARKHTFIDMALWVDGKKFSKWRNPFSTKKLRAAGIYEAQSFKDTLSKYFIMDGAGNLKDLNVAGLAKENPKAYMQMRTLIDNQAMRCIQQETIGNSNLLKESSPFWRVFFQFKDFVMRATHSQTLRALANNEREDYLSALYGIATNAAVVATVAHGKAWALYGDNEAKRQKYLDKYYSTEKLLLAGLMRSPMIGSPVSSVADVAEMTGYSPLPTMRTTVDRVNKPGRVDNPVEFAGQAVAQLPAFKTGFDVAAAPYRVAQMAFQNKPISKRQMNNVLNLMPGQNNLVSMRLREELYDSLNLANRKD